jgi:hypothetical protein
MKKLLGLTILIVLAIGSSTQGWRPEQDNYLPEWPNGDTFVQFYDDAGNKTVVSDFENFTPVSHLKSFLKRLCIDKSTPLDDIILSIEPKFDQQKEIILEDTANIASYLSDGNRLHIKVSSKKGPLNLSGPHIDQVVIEFYDDSGDILKGMAPKKYETVTQIKKFLIEQGYLEKPTFIDNIVLTIEPRSEDQKPIILQNDKQIADYVNSVAAIKVSGKGTPVYLEKTHSYGTYKHGSPNPPRSQEMEIREYPKWVFKVPLR